MGKRLHEAGIRTGKKIDDLSILYLILPLIGLSIINYALMQNDLNKLAE